MCDLWCAPGGLGRLRRAAWAITRMSQYNRMGASPTAPTIPQCSMNHRVPPGAIACGIDAKCPRIAGAAAITSRHAGRDDHPAGRNSSRGGAAQSVLLEAEYGAQYLEFGEPTGGNRGYREGSGSGRRAAVSRIHLTFALYAREWLQREGGKIVKMGRSKIVGGQKAPLPRGGRSSQPRGPSPGCEDCVSANWYAPRKSMDCE